MLEEHCISIFSKDNIDIKNIYKGIVYDSITYIKSILKRLLIKIDLVNKLIAKMGKQLVYNAIISL
jgi:hypothetical protein